MRAAHEIQTFLKECLTLRVFAPSSSEFIPFLTCHPQDRSARVCNFCENGDYIQDEIFSCIGTEHLRHQFIHFFDNISEGDINGFVFNITKKFTNVLVQLSIFLIDLFAGTYRFSSHWHGMQRMNELRQQL